MMSSLGALVGLIGMALGFRWADPIAGFAVTLFICHVGYEVTSEIVHHLMDGIEPQYLAEAEQAIAQVPGLSSATVRGRWMGRSLILEIEGELPGKITLDQAAQIGQQVKAAVRASVAEVRRVHWIPHPIEEPA